MSLQADERGHHAAQTVALWLHALLPRDADALVIGDSTSSGSCCEERVCSRPSWRMLVSCGMTCECWPLLGELASLMRTAWTTYAYRPHLHRETLAMRPLLQCCTVCACALLLFSVGSAGDVTVKICRFLELNAIIHSSTR